MTDLGTTNINRTRMILRGDLVFSPQNYRGAVHYHVELPSRATFYRLGYPEYVFVSLLDGTTSFSQALALTAQRLGAKALSTEQATTIYMWLLENGLGTIHAEDQWQLGTQGVPRQSRSVLPNPLWLKVPFGSPDKLIRRILPLVAWLFSTPATCAGLALIALAGTTLLFSWQRLSIASIGVFSVNNWALLSLTWLGLKVIHELAHAVCCRRYGGEVGDTGVLFVLFAPMAYVDVTSSWRLPSKWRRIHVAAAGIYAELLVASVATFGWQFTDERLASHILYNVILMASVSTLLFNANPLMRFDGYYILSDLLEIPNLQAEASQTLRYQLKRWFLGESNLQIRHRGWTAVGIATYGWLAALWRLIICVSLLLAASVLFHGAGIVLAVVAIVGWLQPLLRRTIGALAHTYQIAPWQVCRATLISTALIAGLSGLFVWLPTPWQIVAPGVIELRDELSVRSLTGGFVHKVFVADGQCVEAGQPLVQLENSQVTRKYYELEIAILQAEMRFQIAMEEHHVAEAQVAERERQALHEQMKETQRRFNSLLVRAPVSGTVMQRLLSSMEGTYVREGDELLIMGNGDQKQLVVSVEQSDFDAVAPRLSTRVGVRVGFSDRMDATLARLEPRASVRLPHPALSAMAGGPLAIVESTSTQNESEAELTKPRFQAVVTIPPEYNTQLFSGQRGLAVLGSCNQSLGWNVLGLVHDWIEQKLQPQE